MLRKLEKIAEVAGTHARSLRQGRRLYRRSERLRRHGASLEAMVPEKSSGALVIPYMGLGGKGSRVEIALTLLANDSPLKIETVETTNAPKPLSHEPQAVKVGNLLFFSQQMPCDDEGTLPAEMQRHPELPVLRAAEPSADAVHAQERRRDLRGRGHVRSRTSCRRACFHDDFTRFAESMQEMGVAFPGAQALLDDPDDWRPARRSRRAHAARSYRLRARLRSAFSSNAAAAAARLDLAAAATKL